MSGPPYKRWGTFAAGSYKTPEDTGTDDAGNRKVVLYHATEINFSKQFVINYELLKYKSLGQAFSKACGVQRQSLGRSSQ